MEPEPEAGAYRAGVGSVTGGARTVLTDSRGPVHTGDGLQVNAMLSAEDLRSYLGEFLPRSGNHSHVPGYIAAEHLSRISRCFIAPPGYTEAFTTLSESRVLFLSGSPGSGRRGAAIQLLQELGPSPPVVRELPDEDESPYLRSQRVGAGESLLLDTYTNSRDELLREVQNELGVYRETVASQSGRLVVVLAPEQERLLREDLRFSLRRIHPPDRHEVLHRHLSHLGVPVPEKVLDEASTRSWLHSAGVGETAELANLIWRTERTRDGAGTFQDWVEEARYALADWDGEVAEQLEQLTASRQRAVLLSAAMFDGLSADRVFDSVEELLHHVAAPGDDSPWLERRGFSAQLHDLGVRLGSDRSVTFPRLDYDAAVRNRFWNDFPNLRIHFENWILGCLDSLPLTEQDRSRLVERLAEQCLRFRRVESLFSMVERWTGRSGANQSTRYGPQQALELLRTMLGDSRSAWATRHRLREWAADQYLSPAFADVLLVVCERILVHTHPEQAVVRMHHLARNRKRRVAGEATQALLKLARDDPDHRRILLERLANRLAADHQGKEDGIRSADVALLWHASDPDILGSAGDMPQEKERGFLTTALVPVMAIDAEETRRHAQRWLAACARDARWNFQLVSLAAAARRAGRKAMLYTVARRWVMSGEIPPERGLRRRTAGLLVEQLGREQGPHSRRYGKHHHDAMEGDRR